MSTIDSIIAANEELTLAIESFNACAKPMSFGRISFALEEAQEHAKEEMKSTVWEKIKALVARLVAWFRQKKEALFARFKKKQEEVKEKKEVPTEKIESFLNKLKKRVDDGDKKAQALVKDLKSNMANPKAWVVENEPFDFCVAGYTDLELSREYVDSVYALFTRLSQLKSNKNTDGLGELADAFEQAASKFNKPAEREKAYEVMTKGGYPEAFSKVMDKITPAMRDDVDKNLEEIAKQQFDGDAAQLQKFINACAKALAQSYKYGDWHCWTTSCKGLFNYFSESKYGALSADEKDYCIHICLGYYGYEDLFEKIFK